MAQIKLDRNLDVVKKRDVDKMTFREIAAYLTVTDAPISESVVARVYKHTKKLIQKVL